MMSARATSQQWHSRVSLSAGTTSWQCWLKLHSRVMAQPGRVASTDNARLSYEPTVLQYVTGSSGIRQWYEAHISASLPLSVQYPAVRGVLNRKWCPDLAKCPQPSKISVIYISLLPPIPNKKWQLLPNSIQHPACSSQPWQLAGLYSVKYIFVE
jgi:hypothetical protein